MRQFLWAFLIVASAAAFVEGVSTLGQAQGQSRPAAGPSPDIDVQALLEHVRALSSDEFEGRMPGTKGEDLSIAYIAEKFRSYGLKSAEPGGTFFQKVPLVGITGTLSRLTLRKGGNELVLRPKDDFVAWTRQAVETTTLDSSELVFVGYGVEAPEAEWDDYKGIDLAGKTLVMLIGDPPVPDPFDSLRLDPNTFGGPAMTYYGRWTYKFDAGAARKAAGVLLVHETTSAGYGFSVVQGRLGEQFDLRTADGNVGRPAVEGWITIDRAKELFTMAGLDFETVKRQAASRSFQPAPLGITASMSIRNTLREVDSRNVIGRLEGSDPELKDECVVYTAHWDHLGHGEAVNGETVRHGAVDNATGVAGLLELARVHAAARPRPRRTVLFLAATAEEQGLLGSEYYVRHPVVPLEKTLAVLNLEMLNVYGKTSDLTVYGLGASELDDYLRDAAANQGRVVKADPTPEQGWYYRSDHFPFARAGVPATWAAGGHDYIGRDVEYGRHAREEYVATRYHKPADIVRPEWNLEGAAQDLSVYREVALAVANAAKYPEWKPGAEFKARRDEMLGRAGHPKTGPRH